MEQKNWNASNEREINLIDLLWKVIAAWRLVIVLAVVFAVIAAGVSYVKSSRQAEQISDSKTVEAELTDAEAEKVTSAQILQQQIEDRREYQQNSVLMNLDAYHKERIILQYYIDSDTVDEGSINLLLSSYNTYLDSKAIVDDMAGSDDLSLENVYIGELISYDNVDVDMDKNMEFSFSQEQLSKLEENRDRALRIYVTAADEKQTNQLADAVEGAISSYNKKLSKELTKHKIVLLGRYESTVTDTDLAQRQIDTQAAIESLQARLDTMTASFTDAQKAVLEADEQKADASAKEESEEAAQQQGGSISKKMVLLGLILGIVVACILVALKYILDGLVKSEDELQNVYGVRVLGTVKANGKKKRLFSGIDDWIVSLRDKNTWSAEEQMQVLLANIEVLCQKDNITKVFLTSESMDDNTKARIDGLAERLRAEGIDAVYETNIAYNAASLKHMAEIGNVILVVSGEYTKYRELEKELMLCGDQDMNVLGVVFLG